MKKLISILLMSAILCVSLFTFIPCVSAANYNWELSPGGEYITHNGKKYELLDVSQVPHFFDHESYLKEEKIKFSDEKTKEKFEGSYLYVYEGAEDVAVQMEVFNNDRYQNSRLYVEESYVQQYKNIAKGISDNYVIYSLFGPDEFEFTEDVYSDWSDSAPVTLEAGEIYTLDQYYIFACDELKLFEAECGMMLYDYYSGELYLLRYSDYDISYFYGDGSFNLDVDEPLTVYVIDEEDIKSELVAFMEDEPEDELEWLVGDGVGNQVALVLCTVFFGIIPMAVLIFSIIMYFAVKDKKYRKPYVIMGIGALLVFIAYSGLLVLLILA